MVAYALAASVLGVDLSTALLAVARTRAASVRGATFLEADAQVHPFSGADVVVSRHGVVFFDDPVAAFANLVTALRPGGRLVLLTWQPFAQQEWMRHFREVFAAGRDLPRPRLALSDPTDVRDTLTAAGLRDVELTSLAEPMFYGTDPEDAAAFLTDQNAGAFAELDATARARTLDDLHADLAAHHGPAGVVYDSACWLITAARA